LYATQITPPFATLPPSTTADNTTSAITFSILGHFIKWRPILPVYFFLAKPYLF